MHDASLICLSTSQPRPPLCILDLVFFREDSFFPIRERGPCALHSSLPPHCALPCNPWSLWRAKGLDMSMIVREIYQANFIRAEMQITPLHQERLFELWCLDNELVSHQHTHYPTGRPLYVFCQMRNHGQLDFGITCPPCTETEI